MSTSPNHHQSIKSWLDAWAHAIANNDIASGRGLFAANVSGFGTITFTTNGVDDLVDRQWAPVWARTKNFAFETEGQTISLSIDANMAIIQSSWNSSRREGSNEPRRGRATIVLERSNSAAPWQCIHTHFSMWPNGADISLGAPIT